MLEQLEHLVVTESPSSDKAACARCADAVTDVARGALGEPERIEIEGATHLRWHFGGPTRVVLVGHFDTVWPLGSIDELPFKIDDGLAWGPGCFDMKAGIVQAVHALASLDSLEGVALLLTSDEEIGSATSRGLVEYTARGASAAFVLEPSVDGALKIARKGVGMYRLEVQGRSAHAGLEPQNRANALLSLAGALTTVATFGDEAVGTTVTPTTAQAGTARNTVPDTAVCEIDVRAESVSEMGRVDVALRNLVPSIADTTFNIVGGINRPPMEASASADLFARAQRLGKELGFEVEGRSVGGGSDGNFTAGIGVATLDGLGAVGDGAHARHEHVVIDEMPKRIALLAALVRDVLTTS
jgi:glutamate carboxypeptidase